LFNATTQKAVPGIFTFLFFLIMQERIWKVRHISTVREFFGKVIYLLTFKDKNTFNNGSSSYNL
jgi:hypothetical protein